jgi:hypothetical protein
MRQNLIDHRFDVAGLKDVVDVRFFKVGKTDGPKLSGLISFLKSSPCFTVSIKEPFFFTEFRPWLWAVMENMAKS